MSSADWPADPGGLTRLPVRVRMARTGDTPALWQGRAEADDRIVALALARFRGSLHWNKSSRRGPWSDDLPGLHVGIWISQCGPSAITAPATVQLQLSGAGPAWSVMTRGPAPVEIRETIDAETATPATLLRVAGHDPLDVALLFIARSDVRSLRSGLWTPRDSVLPGLSPDWAALLSGPRHGTRPL